MGTGPSRQIVSGDRHAQLSQGDAPGVVLKLEESDAAGKTELHQFIVPAQAFNALLSMLHDVRTALTGQPAATPGEKMTVRNVLANMQTDVIEVHAKHGDVRAFMLTLETKDGAGTITANQFVMQPAQMQGLCSLVQETPNPSIERTVTSGLRPLVTAAHVKR